jgi:hypothetical protein
MRITYATCRAFAFPSSMLRLLWPLLQLSVILLNYSLRETWVRLLRQEQNAGCDFFATLARRVPPKGIHEYFGRSTRPILLCMNQYEYELVQRATPGLDTRFQFWLITLLATASRERDNNVSEEQCERKSTIDQSLGINPEIHVGERKLLAFWHIYSPVVYPFTTYTCSPPSPSRSCGIGVVTKK